MFPKRTRERTSSTPYSPSDQRHELIDRVRASGLKKVAHRPAHETLDWLAKSGDLAVRRKRTLAVTANTNGLNNMITTLYDKIIVGGGVAGLASAYEILTSAKKAGKPIKLAVLTEKVNSPTRAGTNIVLGIDGFEDGELPSNAAKLCELVRAGLERLNEVVRLERISCRHDLNLQLIARTKAENLARVKFLEDRFGYRPEEHRDVTNPEDCLHFAGLTEAWEIDIVGQINGPEFLEGLAAVIRRHGGEIIENTSFTGYSKAGATTEVQTTNGTYKTSTPVLYAGGPHLMRKMPGLPVAINPIYTMALHVELTPEDARDLCKRPVAFFNPTLDNLWGSLDCKNVLTFGQDDTDDPNQRDEHEARLRKTFDQLLPHLVGKYDAEMTFSFNAMAFTKNWLPLVGRLADFDVVTGNCGRGFAQSFAEAQAYSDHFINGDDRKLLLFESLNIRP